MKKLILSLSLGGLLACCAASTATAQTAILADVYGRGVHAYYSSQYDEAYQLLSDAIANGIRDPRAYYFRGIVLHSQGRTIEAEADWTAGAQLEAQGQVKSPIGRSLTRYQGAGRLRLESIRRQAKLQFLAQSASRAQKRFGDKAPAMMSETDVLGGPATPPSAPVAPPATDPFANDAVEPAVEQDDALADAMNDPFANDPAAPGDAGMADAPSADPFGDGAGGADPFADPAGGDDPFGGAGDDDPFGGF